MQFPFLHMAGGSVGTESHSAYRHLSRSTSTIVQNASGYEMLPNHHFPIRGTFSPFFNLEISLGPRRTVS